jgi:hypothetical protein
VFDFLWKFNNIPFTISLNDSYPKFILLMIFLKQFHPSSKKNNHSFLFRLAVLSKIFLHKFWRWSNFCRIWLVVSKRIFKRKKPKQKKRHHYCKETKTKKSFYELFSIFHTLFQGGCVGGVLKKSFGYTPWKKLSKEIRTFSPKMLFLSSRLDDGLIHDEEIFRRNWYFLTY